MSTIVLDIVLIVLFIVYLARFREKSVLFTLGVFFTGRANSSKNSSNKLSPKILGINICHSSFKLRCHNR